MASEKIEKKLALLPLKPGVYLMKNASGTIIYVGKSRCLKKRVNSYFNRHHDSSKTNALVAMIDDFEYIITNTEVEALILENNLIKKHNPHYNILLKDNKTYPYIKVTMKDRFPRLEKVRKVAFKDGNLYFGPFPSGYDLNRIIDMLSRNYRLCTSKKAVNNNGKKQRPCLDYHLGICQGICQGNVPPEEYAVSINKAVDVLSGKVKPIVKGTGSPKRDDKVINSVLSEMGIEDVGDKDKDYPSDDFGINGLDATISKPSNSTSYPDFLYSPVVLVVLLLIFVSLIVLEVLGMIFLLR